MHNGNLSVGVALWALTNPNPIPAVLLSGDKITWSRRFSEICTPVVLENP